MYVTIPLIKLWVFHAFMSSAGHYSAWWHERDCMPQPLKSFLNFLIWQNNSNAAPEQLPLFLEEEYNQLMTEPKRPAALRSPGRLFVFLRRPGTSSKLTLKALHSKAVWGGPFWPQPCVPDYINVCQHNSSTCTKLLSKHNDWRVHQHFSPSDGRRTAA